MASLVHRLSKDAVRPELDVFSPPNTQTSIERGFYQEYMPMNALNNSSAIQFCISGQGSDYTDLQHSLLFLRVKIVSSDGSTIPPGAQVGPVNNLLHSLFSACEITLNGKIIGHLNNLYPYRSMLQTIGAYSNEAATGFLQGALFEKDTAGWMESTEIKLPNKTQVIKGFDNPRSYASVVRTTDEATTTDHISIEYKIGNNGLNMRSVYTQMSQPVELIGPLFTDLTTQNRYILNNVDINVKLLRASNEFCLMSGDAEKYKVVIEEASLFARKVKLSDAAFMAHQTTLETTNAIYPISYCQMKHIPIPQGNLNGPNENILLGHMPNELMVCFVEADAFNGSYNLNPFNFKDFKLSQISVRLNGTGFKAIIPGATSNDDLPPLGIAIVVLLGILPLPVFTLGSCVYSCMKRRYTWSQLIHPRPEWGPALNIHREGRYSKLDNDLDTTQYSNIEPSNIYRMFHTEPKHKRNERIFKQVSARKLQEDLKNARTQSDMSDNSIHLSSNMPERESKAPKRPASASMVTADTTETDLTAMDSRMSETSSAGSDMSSTTAALLDHCSAFMMNNTDALPVEGEHSLITSTLTNRPQQGNSSAASLASSLRCAKFPTKMWQLVNQDTTGSIYWNRTGDGIIVNPVQFSVHYLRTAAFKTNRLSSFIRQMNLYGFRKVCGPSMDDRDPRRKPRTPRSQPMEFKHRDFIRDRPDVLCRVHRITLPAKSRSAVTPAPIAKQSRSRKRKQAGEGDGETSFLPPSAVLSSQHPVQPTPLPPGYHPGYPPPPPQGGLFPPGYSVSFYSHSPMQLQDPLAQYMMQQAYPTHHNPAPTNYYSPVVWAQGPPTQYYGAALSPAYQTAPRPSQAFFGGYANAPWPPSTQMHDLDAKAPLPSLTIGAPPPAPPLPAAAVVKTEPAHESGSATEDDGDSEEGAAHPRPPAPPLAPVTSTLASALQPLQPFLPPPPPPPPFAAQRQCSAFEPVSRSLTTDHSIAKLLNGNIDEQPAGIGDFTTLSKAQPIEVTTIAVPSDVFSTSLEVPAMVLPITAVAGAGAVTCVVGSSDTR